MYLHLGQSVMVPYDSIIGVFDLDNTTWSHRTRSFLEQADREGRLTEVGDDLPKSFVLCQEEEEGAKVYITQPNTATVLKRLEGSGFE